MRPFFEWRDAPAVPFAVLGDPIHHSLSPAMFAAVLGRGHYVALRVPADEFDAAMDHLVNRGYQGVNVTLPLKFAARKWASSCEPPGVEAINCVRFCDRAGANTDILGIQSQIPASAQSALVLGAGGTAFSAVRACLNLGLKTSIWNRTTAKAAAICDQFPGVTHQIAPSTDGVDLVIQTTSAERLGPPLELHWCGKPGLFLDLNYTEGGLTQACLAAQTHGWQAVDGVGVLVTQAVAAYAFWTGETLDSHLMEKAARS